MNSEIKILVIDDSPSILEGLRLMLGIEGHTVETATTLAEGLAAANQSAFDLVITDMQLPDDPQGGLTILRSVKSRTPETEVIIITGYGSIAQAVEATKAGAFYFVEKPFDPEQILILTENAVGCWLNLSACENASRRRTDTSTSSAAARRCRPSLKSSKASPRVMPTS